MNSAIKKLPPSVAKLLTPAGLFLTLSPFFFGLFHEYCGCIAGALLFVYLFFVTKKSSLTIPVGFEAISILLIPAGYLVTCIWAIDSGDAFSGFMKYLPLIPFTLLAARLDTQQKERLLFTVPVSGCAMTALSFLGYLAPQTKEFLYLENERLGGFFQYSNSFAMYLLIGIVVLAFAHKNKLLTAGGMLLLASGIFFSGSRTVFILLVLAVAALGIMQKRIRKLLIIVVAACAVILTAAVLITKNYETVGRFLTTSLSNSTLLGRLLYYLDALPILLRRPFGLGYGGYYYYQQAIQTGEYSVKFLHNDYLQLAVDIGVIPALLFGAALIKSCFVSKNNTKMQKLIIFLLAGHFVIDFDLQFLSIFFVLILCLDLDSKTQLTLFKEKKKKRLSPARIACLAATVLSLYFTAAFYAVTNDKAQIAQALYPCSTTMKIRRITQETTPTGMDTVANDIIKTNEYVAIAWDAKARYSYSRLEFADMIEYKRRAISIARYDIAEYEDFCSLLITAAQKCQADGDTETARLCIEELIGIPEALDAVKQQTSSLAWKLDEKPELELNAELEQYISQLIIQNSRSTR